jgi:threonine/homoserine/homoserine lactone efflux protein
MNNSSDFKKGFLVAAGAVTGVLVVSFLVSSVIGRKK